MNQSRRIMDSLGVRPDNAVAVASDLLAQNPVMATSFPYLHKLAHWDFNFIPGGDDVRGLMREIADLRQKIADQIVTGHLWDLDSIVLAIAA